MVQVQAQTVRSKVAAFLTGLLAVAAALPVAAQSTGASVSVTVNATVQGVCRISTSDPVMTIGNTGSGTSAVIAPDLTGPATGSVGIDYKCTKGVNTQFTVPASQNLSGPNSSVMQATFTYSPASAVGQGFGAGPQTLTINGAIAQAQYQNAEVGLHTATITVEVNP